MLYFGLCFSVPYDPPRRQSGPHCAAAPALPWAGAEAGAGALPSQQTLAPCAVKNQRSCFHLTALCRAVMEGNVKAVEANTMGKGRAHF